MKILESWKKFEAFIEEKNLPAEFVVGIFKIIGMFTIAILIFWGFNFYEKSKSESYREEVFSSLLDANGYDKKIVGLKAFELHWVVRLVEDENSVEVIPKFPQDVIYKFNTGEKHVILSKAMPQFFTEKEIARNIVCLQGQVRKRNRDLSFGKFEDKFTVLYNYSVPRENQADFSRRIEGIESEQEKVKEKLLRKLFGEKIDSNSKLHDGTCVDTFQGWIAEKSS